MADTHSSTKKCKHCGQDLPYAAFSANRHTRDGLAPGCKSCYNQMRQARRHANPAKTLKEHQTYYQKNKEKIIAKVRAHQLANAEHRRAYMKAYQTDADNKARKSAQIKAAYIQDRERYLKRQREQREANPDKANGYSAAYRQRHPERRRAVVKANKARRRSAPGACSPEQWLAKIEYFGWRCYLCHLGLTSETLHMEHRKPLSRGGSHWPANLAPACGKCNLRKQDKSEAEFRAILEAEG